MNPGQPTVSDDDTGRRESPLSVSARR